MSEIKYPDITVNIIGQNGNAFCILGICKRAMERAKLPQTEIDSFMSEAMSGGYRIGIFQEIGSTDYKQPHLHIIVDVPTNMMMKFYKSMH